VNDEKMTGKNRFKSSVVPIVVSLIALGGILFVVIHELTESGSAQRDFSAAVELSASEMKREGQPGPVLYQRVADIPLEVARPRGIAAGPEGRLFLCAEEYLLEIDAAGKVKNRVRLPDEGQCLAYDGDKTMYIGLSRSVAALRLDTGELRIWSDFDELSIITSIAVSGPWVYVADAGNAALYRYDRWGKLEDRLEGFLVPSPYLDAAAQGDGSVWITDPGRHTVNLYASSGELLLSWGAYSRDLDGFSGCCNPIHLAILPNGSVVTIEKGMLWIKVFSADGVFQGIVATPDEFPQSNELDLAADREGRILVLLSRAGRVCVYERISP